MLRKNLRMANSIGKKARVRQKNEMERWFDQGKGNGED